MNNITVSVATRSIVLSKKFAKASCQYGTEEYRMLQEVRRDYPGFKVVEVSRKNPKSSKNTFKGLTYEYMEAYISTHDDKEQTTMAAYMVLRGETDEADAANSKNREYVSENQPWGLRILPQQEKCRRQQSKYSCTHNHFFAPFQT